MKYNKRQGSPKILRIALRQIKNRIIDWISNINPGADAGLQTVLYSNRLGRLEERGSLDNRLSDINCLMHKESDISNFKLVKDMLNCDAIWSHFNMYARFIQELDGRLKHKVFLRRIIYNAIENYWDTFLVCHYKRVYLDLSGRSFYMINGKVFM